ncbi:hypothetical protein [Nisaea sp.]|uniref:hypothetical protein n=1 Tax=Nisaea sp. TaxID=2024842 RepID=UPI0032EED6AA
MRPTAQTQPSTQAQASQPAAQDVEVVRVRTDGTVTVRTPAGEAAIQVNPRQIPAFLRPGAVVNLILQRTNNGLQAVLQPRAPVSGNIAATSTASPAQQTSAAGTPSSAASATAPAPKPLPDLSSGQIARAIVLRPTSLPQGIASAPIPAAGAGINPQQAAQAAARYLLATGTQLKPSSIVPQAPLAATPSSSGAAAPQPATGASSLPGTPASPQQAGTAIPGASQQNPAATQPLSAQTPQVTARGATSLPTAGTQPGTQAPTASGTPAPVTTTIAPRATTAGQTSAAPQSAAISATTAPPSLQDSRNAATTTGQTRAAAPTAAGTVAPRPAAALPPGTDFPVRVLSVGAQTSNALPAQSGGGGTVISGTIVASGGSGHAIVNSSVGLLDVAARAGTGQLQSEVRMEMLGRAEGDMRGLTGTGSQTPLSVLSREWPALEESLRALEIAAPQSAAQIASTIARPGPQLTASMLFFLAAVRGGSLGGWLGRDAGQALEKSHARLLSTLSGDFQSLTKASDGGPETGGWRAFFMPIQTQDTLEQIRLFVLPPPYEAKGEENSENDEDSGENASDAETRFVVDLMLSGLGAFQIDGSVAKQSMSLLIRTRQALPQQMRADIIDIFDTAAGRTGMSGAVSFKVQKEFPPLPVADLIPDGNQNPDIYA